MTMDVVPTVRRHKFPLSIDDSLGTVWINRAVWLHNQNKHW